VSSIFGGGKAITSGNLISVLYTPNVNIKKVEFRYLSSGYNAPEGNTISLVSYIVSDKYALEENVRVAEDLSDVNGKLYYKGNPIAIESQLSDVVTDLPVSDGTGIQPGYAYIDSTDRTIKVKA